MGFRSDGCDMKRRTSSPTSILPVVVVGSSGSSLAVDAKVPSEGAYVLLKSWISHAPRGVRMTNVPPAVAAGPDDAEGRSLRMIRFLSVVAEGSAWKPPPPCALEKEAKAAMNIIL
jgi:hypothetical protein